jgi:hypothetical protein
MSVSLVTPHARGLNLAALNPRDPWDRWLWPALAGAAVLVGAELVAAAFVIVEALAR